MGTTVTFNRPDGKPVGGYLAEAADAGAPGIVVIQEWWGLNDQIRGVADRLARAGYHALVPDLYRGKSTVEAEEAHHLMSGLDFGDAASQDVRGAARLLAARGAKVGVTGFCMGGALTLLASCNVPELDAACIWYGYPPLEFVDAAKIKAPLMGHWANDDAAFAVAGVDTLEGKLRAAGVGADRLCDELIAPTVRALGERWDDDRCDFAQVSIGLGRLRSLVHRVGADASGGVRSRPTGRMLVATLPGRDHLLGAVIVADAFRRAGWDVSFDPGAGEATLLDAVGERRFDVIGLSVGLERDGPAVRALLAALRAASLNPGVTTMVGGPALRLRPALRAELGADLAATDAREAVACAALALRARSRASDARAGAPPLPAQRTVAAPAADPRTTPPPAGARRRRARLRRDAALRRAGAIGVPGAPAG